MPSRSDLRTLIVFENFTSLGVSEGTYTRVHGTGFTFDINGNPTGGTVTSVGRTDDAMGTTVYETISHLDIALTSFAGASDFFDIVLAGNDLFVGWSGADVFQGRGGGDTYIGFAGSNTVSYANVVAAPGTSTGVLRRLWSERKRQHRRGCRRSLHQHWAEH